MNYLALRTLSEGLLDRMPEGSAIVNTASLAGNTWRTHVAQIDEVLALDVDDTWKPSLEWFDGQADGLEQGPYNFTKEIVVRYTMRSSRAKPSRWSMLSSFSFPAVAKHRFGEQAICFAMNS